MMPNNTDPISLLYLKGMKLYLMKSL